MLEFLLCHSVRFQKKTLGELSAFVGLKRKLRGAVKFYILFSKRISAVFHGFKGSNASIPDVQLTGNILSNMNNILNQL